jgi:hypothetical protein
MAEVKVGVYEVDGVEYSTPVERILDMQDCKFNPAPSSLTSVNGDAALKELASLVQSLKSPHPSSGWRIVENWISGTAAGNNNWVTTANSGLVGITTASGTTSKSGIVSIGTSTSATSAPTLGLGGTSGIVFGSRRVVFESRVFIPLATTVQDFVCRIGLHTSTTSAVPTHGIYLEYSRATSLNWICRAVQNSTPTSVTSTVAVQTNTWIWVKIEMSLNNTSALYYVAPNPVSDGVLPTYTLLGTITTNLPSGIGQTTGAAYQIIKTAGTTTRNLLVDCCVIESLSF